MKYSMMITAALFVFGLNAQAQTDSYSVDVARVQMDLNCQISKANSGTTSCSIQVNSQGAVSILMKANGDTTSPGFGGTDQITDGDAVYALVLEADATKNLHSVALMRMVQTAQGSVNATLSVTDSNSLTAVNIAPLTVTVVDSQTMSISLTVVAYAPKASVNMVTTHDQNALKDFVLKKIQPVIDAARP